MATVYLAEDLKHQRKVAIKVLRQELSATLGSERFAREIAVAARLQHPHILGLFGIYRVALTGGTPQLLVRFDAPQLQLHPGGTLTVRNGIVYFVARELESDIYVMELVRK